MSKVVRGMKNIPKFKPEGAYRAIYNLAGMRFGDITVTELVSSSPVLWKCRCVCGNELVRSVSDITRDWHGRSNSCGCKKQAFAKGPLKEYSIGNKFREKHGDAPSTGATSLYKRWVAMKQRCQNPKCREYKWYGGKGVKICDEWQEYENFKHWAEKSGYKESLTIDRINPDGDYCPENCRWVDWSVQGANKTVISNTGVVGISKVGGWYQASLTKDGKKINKNFRQLDDAIKFRKDLERRLLCAA